MKNKQAQPSLGRFSSQRQRHDLIVKSKIRGSGREHTREKLARGYELRYPQAIIEKD